MTLPENFSDEFPNFFHTSDGFRIFYNTNFKASDLKDNEPVIVFNYGLLCSNKHFKYQIPYFKKKGYKILTHDYRFHFNSSSSDNIKDCNFDGITKDLFELTQELNITNTIQVGHSMGVNTCLEFAKKFPQRVNGMILISGTVFPPQDVMFDSNIVDIASPLIENLIHEYPDAFEKVWKTMYMNPIARKLIRRGGFNTEKVGDDFIQIYLKKIGELPKELFLHLLNEMKSHDIISHLESIETETLIIGGDKDKVIPNYLQLILNSYLPNSDFYIVKNGSHVPQVDFPEIINERIDLFIQNL